MADDDVWYDSPESEEELGDDSSRTRRVWCDNHFEVLQELYRAFKNDGQVVFGRAFFQFGDFSQFVRLIYDTTVGDDADLLKATIAETHVRAVGLSARGEYRLPVVEKATGHGPSGSSGEGVRSWSGVVRTCATRRC